MGDYIGNKKSDGSKDFNQDDGEEEWQHVRFNKEKRSGSSNSILNRLSMSFYITNFPHNITSKDLYTKCSELGIVTDVFISNRLSKAGKRFGFVRFAKVGNAEKLLIDLRSTWLGNFKLFADIEKYGRKFQQSESMEKKESVKNDVGPKVNKGSPQNSKTFAEVLSSDSGNESNISMSCRVVKIINSNSVSVDVNSRSVLVKVNLPEHIPYARIWLNEEGFSNIVVHYVGGRWIHIEFPNVEAKNSFMANDNLKHRYLVLKSPCESFVPDERMVWVNIHGIPKGAWTNEIFQSILGSWGKGVFFGPKWESSASTGRVCVLTQSKKHIFEELAIEFQNKRLDIWIKEFEIWDPKILRVAYESESPDVFDSSEERVGDTESLETEDSIGHSTSFDSKLCKGSLSNSQNVVNQVSYEHVVNEGNANYDKPDHNTTGDNQTTGMNSCNGEHESGLSGKGVCEDSDNQNSSIPEVAEESSSLDRSSDKAERLPHHNNGLDDIDILLLNRLLHQDKSRVMQVKAVVNDSGIVSPSMPLDHEKRWRYRDPDGNVHGPFSIAQLHMWKDCFPSNLKIWRYNGNVKETILLLSALKRRTKDVG